MKVLFICGSYPPELDSNADTSEIMVNILKDRNIDVELLSNIDWSLSEWFKINKIIKKSNADVIHIQYPSHGYKYSITPQLLSFIHRKKIVITLHEASQLFIVRKLSLLPFSWCKKIVFTNVFEQRYYKKIYPWTNMNNSFVVPIGSNISSITNLDHQSRGLTKIVHFGQIRPQKGIEEVLQLAELIKQKELPFTVVIMGRTYDKFMDFFEDIKKRSEGLPVEWLLNVSEETVSEVLGSNVIAYLPYPDGVSERRGSFFASMIHNMAIFTTKGKQTLPDIDPCVIYVDTPLNMLEYLQSENLKTELAGMDGELRKNISTYMKKYSWENIMDEYIKLYRQI